MSTPTIPAGNLYMNATTYTGTGAVQDVINGVAGQSFQPDFTWFKSRNAVNEHIWVDSVRGVNQDLFSSTTNAEATVTDRVLSFNSNGVTVGVDASRGVNYAGQTQVVWQWKAGGAAVSNTAGSITSQVSANTTSGFSVVTYTGTGSNATVGHGLGVAPSMVIVKSRSDASTYWCVYQSAMWATSGANYTMLLPDTGAAASRPTLFNSTQPTSSVFSIGTNGGVNNSGSTYVAYCWSQIAGYSAFGSYTGNGSTDGPFVYLGFRPRFVLIKRSDSTGNWILEDTSRSTYNVTAAALYPNLSNAEDTAYPIDIISNGFKIRSTDSSDNANGGTFIYAAFAENPFKYSLAR